MVEIKVLVSNECKEEAEAVLKLISELDNDALRDFKNRLIGAIFAQKPA